MRDAMRRMSVWMLASTMVVAVDVTAAHAQQSGIYRGSATAFFGSVFAGDLPRTSITLGGAVAVNESSGWGADMDFSFADDDGVNAVDTLAFMVNANWTRPSGQIRPYLSGGLGTLRVHGCLSGCPTLTSTTDLGANAGGGAYFSFTDIVFARAEVKYIWAPGRHPDLSRPDNYGFVRAVVGVTLMWTIAP